MRPSWRFETGLFVALLLALLALVPSRLFQDPGVFWHTRIGLDLLDSGELPRHDTFTYTKAGEPWICQYWLCDLAMGGLYRLAGWSGLLVVTAVILAGTFAWLGGRLYGVGLDGVLTVLVLILAVAACAPQFHVRPLVVTLYLMGLELILLADIEASRRSLKQLAWLVPVFILWTNIHGGVIGGLATLALVTAGWLLWGVLKLEGPVRSLHDGLVLSGISIACALTVLANPYGLELPKLWLEILGLPLSEFVIEHAPLWRDRGTAVAPVLVLLMFLPFVLSVRPRQMRVTWLMPLVWFLLACQKSRHAAIFAVTVLAVLPDILPHCAFRRVLIWRELYAAPPEGSQPSPSWQRWILPAAVLIVALGLQAGGVNAPLIGAQSGRLNGNYWPVSLVPKLEEIAAQPGVRIFNDDSYGGFLIFHVPGLPVFIDDRCELFGEEFLRGYVTMTHQDPSAFEAARKRWGFTHALVKRGTPLEKHLSESSDWKVLENSPPTAPSPRSSLYEWKGAKPAAGN